MNDGFTDEQKKEIYYIVNQCINGAHKGMSAGDWIVISLMFLANFIMEWQILFRR